MSKEIERKFLVTDDSYTTAATQVIHIAQGYLSTQRNATVRVRISDEIGFLTVKSRNRGITRDEWEYRIPLEDAQAMLKCCQSTVIEKYRYIVPYEGYKWEVDRFIGRHSGLVVAEIELPSEDAQFTKPPFIGSEVTGDPRYYNSNLARTSDNYNPPVI